MTTAVASIAAASAIPTRGEQAPAPTPAAALRILPRSGRAAGHRRAARRVGEVLDEPRSSRRSTRSAIAAASGSWVTSTTARSPRVRRRASTRLPVLGVEVAGRLVGEHEVGVVDQRASDGETLLLAARELVGEMLGDGGEAELVDQPAGPGARRRGALRPAARGAARSRRRSAPRRGGRTERRSRCDAGGLGRRRASAERGEVVLRRRRSSPRVGAVEAAEQVQQRRLARARASEHRDDLAGLHIEGDAVEHPPLGPPPSHGLGDRAGLENGHRVTVPCGRAGPSARR